MAGAAFGMPGGGGGLFGGGGGGLGAGLGMMAPSSPLAASIFGRG